jgi:hypothetical protein
MNLYDINRVISRERRGKGDKNVIICITIILGDRGYGLNIFGGVGVSLNPMVVDIFLREEGGRGWRGGG